MLKPPPPLAPKICMLIHTLLHTAAECASIECLVSCTKQLKPPTFRSVFRYTPVSYIFKQSCAYYQLDTSVEKEFLFSVGVVSPHLLDILLHSYIHKQVDIMITIQSIYLSVSQNMEHQYHQTL